MVENYIIKDIQSEEQKKCLEKVFAGSDELNIAIEDDNVSFENIKNILQKIQSASQRLNIERNVNFTFSIYLNKDQIDELKQLLPSCQYNNFYLIIYLYLVLC